MNVARPSTTRNKPEWRQHFKTELKTFLVGGDKVQMDTAVARAVRDFLPPQGGVVAAFAARADEPEIVLRLGIHDPQWQWAFPRVEGDQLQFYVPPSVLALRPGSYGLLEPDPKTSQRMPIEGCSTILVPGLGFDHAGMRLGRGQGFYDRMLLEFSGLKVGVGYSVQVTEQRLPRDPQDVAMDVIVTEKFLLKMKG